MNSLKHIFLVGFMGSGKTTIGKLLAPKLNRPFWDTDALIEKTIQKTIPEIFQVYGEPKFREFETEIIQSLADYSPSVVALGGGAFISSRNQKAVRESGLCIYLKWPIDILYKRLQSCQDRPLLQQKESTQLYDFICNLLSEREPYYLQADLIIECHQYPDEQALTSTIFNKIRNIT